MTEYYITVHKKAAPAATRDDPKGAKADRHGTTNILAHRLPRVNWGGIFGGLMGALVAAAVWVPVAYAQRGYWAVGGEIFLIGLAAGLGAWMRRRTVKCDMDCKNCKRPAKKCHGGNFSTPYTCRDCVPTKKPHEGPSIEYLPALNRCGKKVKGKDNE